MLAHVYTAPYDNPLLRLLATGSVGALIAKPNRVCVKTRYLPGGAEFRRELAPFASFGFQDLTGYVGWINLRLSPILLCGWRSVTAAKGLCPHADQATGPLR